MYQIGDKIVYPMYGAGVIKDIEEKEILGETRSYYIFQMDHSNMQVMIPQGKTDGLGIRGVVDSDTLEQVLEIIFDGEPDLSVNRHQRYHLNVKKLKSGDIFENAQVIRDLVYLRKQQKISTQDKSLLDNALQILTSELILVKGLTEEQATEMLNKKIS
ncbi:CarD family transcriptional regulator [Bacillus alkalicellulosilyticus]|uniref:CarD family transcriptional regulator n=1 Tax=Alkalihalobacterium alkalicellulosilyticum TaxID=1912214 RepID=UPI000995E49A|nr:CarD family transcriptional regulator [Bacillus alkalicellulosilyticus]